jgi:alcohol dehydrogenase
MRAVAFEDFGGAVELVEVAKPTAAPGGVVIEVKATGLCRSDWHGWQGHDSDIVSLPHIPGHEFAGIIAEVGEGVSGLAVGARVTVPFVVGCGECELCLSGNAQVCPQQWQPGFSGPGSYAEFVAIPNAQFNVVKLPDEIDFATAASLGCRFATSYRGLVDVGSVAEGEWVAVFGCGGVGLAAVMIAKAHGAKVIAVDISPAALDAAKRAGADYSMNPTELDVESEIQRLTSGGVHLSVDALGSIPTSSAAVASLRAQGRHVQIGLLPPAMIQNRATIPMHLVIGRELKILGSHGMSASDYPRLLSEIASGTLTPQNLIGSRISLVDAPAALMELSNSSATGVTIIEL